MAIDKTNHIDYAGLEHFKSKQDAFNQTKFDAKVNAEENKRLMTTAEGSKLEGVAEGAQVNVIETVKVNGTALTVAEDGKSVNIDLSEYAKSADYTSALLYKGTKPTYSELPTEGNKTGDVYNITAADPENGINAGDNVAWNGESWDNLAGVVDLSGKVDKEDGKGLSTEDFTSELKTKLENIGVATNDDIDEMFKAE